MTLVSILLLSSLALHTVLGVITSQGPRWPAEEDGEIEVRSKSNIFSAKYKTHNLRTMK